MGRVEGLGSELYTGLSDMQNPKTLMQERD